MAKFDLDSRLNVAQSIVAQTVAAAPENGAGVDLQQYHAAMFVLDVGTLVGTNVTVKFQHSDDNSTYADVPAGDLVGAQPPVITTSNDVAVFTAGYKGHKRYVRIAVTAATALTGIPLSGTIVRGKRVIEPA